MTIKKYSEEDFSATLRKLKDLEQTEKDKETVPEYWKYEDAPQILEMATKKGGMAFDLPLLDDITEGLKEGELVVVSAPTGVGKTTFCQTLTWNLSQKSIPTLWFTLEVTLANFLRPFIANDPTVERDTESKLMRVKGRPIYFPKNLEQLSFYNLRKIISYAATKFDVKVVFIDHLHYLARIHDQHSRMDNFSLFLGDRVRELRRIAMETGVTIVLVAHMGKTMEDSVPTLNDIRDSSFVAQEADIVLMLWREKAKRPVLEQTPHGHIEQWFYPWTMCKVEKSRRTGKRGTISFEFKKGFYEQITPQQIVELRGLFDFCASNSSHEGAKKVN
jgi:replicative DNA helicase